MRPLYWEVYCKPSLDSVCRYVMLLHNPVTAVYQISYLGIYTFWHVRNRISPIHNQLCYCLRIFCIRFLWTIIIKLFNLLNSEWIDHYQCFLMILHILCKRKPVVTSRLTANQNCSLFYSHF